MDHRDRIAYFVPCRPGAVYVNVTDACLNDCLFCIKRSGHVFFGTDLSLNGRSLDPCDILGALRAVSVLGGVKEVVFCGMGEPLLRYECVIEVCVGLRGLGPAGPRIRVDTSGLFWAKTPKLDVLDWIDVLSVSLNAESAQKYSELCRPTIDRAYDVLMGFLAATKRAEEEHQQDGRHFPEVRLSVVDTSEEEFLPDSGRRAYEDGAFPVPDFAECARIASTFGWRLLVKKLFRDSQDPRWDDQSFQEACARGIEHESCRDCPHRH